MQRFLRLAGFLGAAAGTEEEQAKNFQWGLRRSTLNHLMCMSYTDVAQVVNAARNYEILHERDDVDTERPDKRQRSGDRHQPTSQQSSHRSHGPNNDRHGSDRRIPAMDVTKETEAIPATHVYVSKEPREKIPRAFAWKMILPFSWAKCRTLFVGGNLSPPLETLTPTKAESKSDWWKTSLEHFKGKDVQSEAVISTLEGTVTTLTQTVLSLQGSIGTLESRLLVLEGNARISTLTQTVSSLQGTIDNLESRLLALEGDERNFGVVSDGDIPAYMSLGPSYTSPASTAQKSLPLANRRKLHVRRTPLKLKSPMRFYSCMMRCTIPLPASTIMPPVTTILVSMTTTKPKLLKDTKDAAKDVTKDVAKDTISVPMTTTDKLKDTIHIDAAAQDTFYTEDELHFIVMEKGDKPNYDLSDVSKIKRNKYPIYSTFEKKKTDCYLDCLPKGRTCEPSFWDILYPGGEKAE
nr:zinc finger, CCHC-type, retrotransposon Gag domain protein [Tanacetum cinerariifolium]